MPRRFADAETISATGAFLVGELERLAICSASAVKNYMQTADFEPLKPRTIANRNRSRLTKGTRENEMEGLGIRPLINTGQLRDAIDGVVVEE